METKLLKLYVDYVGNHDLGRNEDEGIYWLNPQHITFMSYNKLYDKYYIWLVNHCQIGVPANHEDNQEAIKRLIGEG